MKKITKTLLMVLLVLVTATSCGKDEPDGKWAKMKWKAPDGLVKLQEGVYQVPLSGGSFTFICENYEPWISSITEIGPDVSQEYLGPNSSIEGEWCTVKCEKKYVTIIFSPATEDESHELEVVFTAGDVFYKLYFVQRNLLY
jgi:hypothetical protein